MNYFKTEAVNAAACLPLRRRMILLTYNTLLMPTHPTHRQTLLDHLNIHLQSTLVKGPEP